MFSRSRCLRNFPAHLPAPINKLIPKPKSYCPKAQPSPKPKPSPSFADFSNQTHSWWISVRSCARERVKRNELLNSAYSQFINLFGFGCVCYGVFFLIQHHGPDGVWLYVKGKLDIPGADEVHVKRADMANFQFSLDQIIASNNVTQALVLQMMRQQNLTPEFKFIPKIESVHLQESFEKALKEVISAYSEQLASEGTGEQLSSDAPTKVKERDGAATKQEGNGAAMKEGDAAG